MRCFTLIDIKYDFTKAGADLAKKAEDQIPFATSLAINKTLNETRQHIKEQMDTYIEGGPTGHTRRGMRVYATSKFDQVGAITFTAMASDSSKDRGYMKELMYSGNKKARNDRLPEPVIKNMKKFAPRFFTPKGNVSRGFYNMARKKGHKQYFIGIPKPGKKHWKGNHNLIGVWRRDPASGKLNMMISLKRSSRQQRKTFPAPELARKFFEANIDRQYREAFIFAIRTM